jgi:hypothetical protein
MYHTIEFAEDYLADLEISRNQPLERLRIRRGSRMRVQMRPYVVELAEGPTEVADLFFEDGTATRKVPFSCFNFVD